ncbi:ABC transporter permease [Clostridium lacusfryxellense]|uniref:ABC transporter permease n=1 Tax=Clostridium lacusfryxellense TaxID=205328 RepID=UPI001C0BB40F|nr:ABC transporter permease subunit [Clostridium lacusfryxellense]MBU3112211.1 ABC transporter permease subunit [Clostridium lacusfryxellense]
MEVLVKAKKEKKLKSKKKKITLKLLLEQKYLMIMSFPFVIWAIVFAYVPLWGWTMAFQDYKPNLTFLNQKWVGLKHFKVLFAEDTFREVMRNTLGMSLLNITFGFAIPIIFALLLNELKIIRFKKMVQTISYLPHFVSWVIAASIITSMLSPEGVVNAVLLKVGILDTPISLLTHPKMFWSISTIAGIWKETGWGAIIYLAAISGIDQSIYEAAKVDGANRFDQMWHVTLPGIRPTIMVILVLSIGNLINIGFEQQYLLQNPLVMSHSRTLDYYVLGYGIQMYRYSFGTAIGIFKSVVSVVLLLLANNFAKKIGEGRVM